MISILFTKMDLLKTAILFLLLVNILNKLGNKFSEKIQSKAF